MFPFKILLFSVVLVGFTACDVFTPSAPPDHALLDGPIEGLTPAQMALFLRGDGEFGRRFAFSEGLGPIFNAASCDTCHPGDGRAHPEFAFLRFGRIDSTGAFDPMLEFGGPQLQDRGVPGYPPEALPDGDITTSIFLAPAMTGLGLLEAVEDDTLLALADPDDADGDGISGRIQWVPADERIQSIAAEIALTRHPNGYIGRFGRKASNISLLHQAVSAYHQDMGLTSDFATVDLINHAVGPAAADVGPDPEVSSDVLFAVTFYLRTLRPPARRDANSPDVLAGEQLFAQVGCDACHVPVLTTGPSAIAALSNTEAWAYTDLLLHDMGSELDDGYSEGVAGGSEWRTTPLWGLGLAASTTGGGRPFLLHDGRARSIPEAIELHGGEAASSRAAYRALTDNERRQLLAFLESL